MRRQLAAAAGRRPAIATPPRSRCARVLHAVDAVQRLGPLGAPRPARHQRPPLLPRRRGAALAHRAGRATDGVHRGRRLASAADLGHGHRQPGRHRRRPARGVPHEPGRQQAADPRRRRARTDYRDIALELGVTAQRPVHGRRRPAVDGVASRVRRREQRRHRRPVRHEGERRGAGRPGEPRSQQPADRSARTARSTEQGEAAGIVELRAGARRRGRRPEPRRPARPRRRQPARQRRRSGATSGAGARNGPRRWATGSTCGWSSRHRTSTPSAPGSTCGSATAPRREVTVGGGHAERRARLDPRRHRHGRARPTSACSGPTAPSDRG